MNNMFIKTESSLTRGIPRTMFKKPFTHKTSFNAGVAVPLLCERVYPGTTIKMDLHSITRMATPVNPIMDDIYQDFHFFFVPMRVILEKVAPFSNEWNSADKNWDKFIAYGDWNEVSDLKLPTLFYNGRSTLTDIKPGSIGHYLGLPLGRYNKVDFSNRISLLQAGAYTLIWNQYFRDENYQDERAVDPDYCYEYKCYFVNELHDPFTSVLPSPQKGPDVGLSLVGNNSLVPVVAGPVNTDASSFVIDSNPYFPGVHPLSFGKVNDPTSQFIPTPPQTIEGVDATHYSYGLKMFYGAVGPGNMPLSSKNGLMIDNDSGANEPTGTAYNNLLTPNNLYANFGAAAAMTINQLRESILLQHYFETLARAGSRYNEWLLGFFQVVSPDARLQRAEYICGHRMHINISEVLQTSGEAVNDTVLGTTGAVSRTTNSRNGLFTYSAVEHGFLFCISTVRHALSYSQGLARQFTDIEALDFYNPIFNGIGEQPIFKREVLLNVGDTTGENTARIKRPEFASSGMNIVNFGENASILGYNEPWWDVRYNINRASGLLDPVGATSLNTWTLTKTFEAVDITGASVRVADDTTIDRVIRVQNEDQFIGEYLFDMEVVAKIPLRSLPGLTRI